MTDTTAAETPTLGPDLDLPKWKDDGEALAKEHAAHQWKIADWILTGIDNFPAADVYAEALKLFPQYSKATLITYASVARAFPPIIRNKGLTFGHHQVAMTGETGNYPDAPLTAIIRQTNLAAAAAAGWTVGQLRDHINHELEIRMAAKEAERLAAEPPVEPPPPRKPKGRPLSAWTLANLTPDYRSRLEKLAIARCVPVPVLAQSILEQALNDAEEEITAVEDSAYRAEAARKANEERQKAEIARRATELRLHIDNLVREYGGTAADYELAVQEWKERAEAMKAAKVMNAWGNGQEYPGDSGGRFLRSLGISGIQDRYEYAVWRVHKMEAQAWTENSRFDRDREAIEAEAWAENARRNLDALARREREEEAV